MCRSEFDKTYEDFLPEGSLDDILAHIGDAGIYQELCVSNPSSSDEKLLAFIKEKARCLFAICAYIGLKGHDLRKAMSWFLHYKDGYFDDTKLPIKVFENVELSERMALMHEEKYNDLTDEEFEELLGDKVHIFLAIESHCSTDSTWLWNRERIWDFQDHQRKFTAPVLSDGKSNHDLWRRIVPFDYKDRSVFKVEGSYGTISKYRIHKKHLRDPMRPVRQKAVLRNKQLR